MNPNYHVCYSMAPLYMHKPFSFGVGVKHNMPTNKPTNIAYSFDEKATV